MQSGNSYTHARAHEAICFFVLEILLEPIIFLFIPKLLLALSTCKYWWPEVELNHRHTDFQSVALPTELSGLFTGKYECKYRSILRVSKAGLVP